MNAEISAYSSGDLPKHEYLTEKDLGYEQAKFEYSPLGKIFTDGLDKSDKSEGLLKRLKNIEDKSNNQLLTIKNISRPAIKGKNNGNVSDEYKTIQDFKQELIDKNILKLSGVKKFDDIANKWKQTKNKSIKGGIKMYQEYPLTDRKKRIIDNSNKVIKGINLFKSVIDNGEFKIPKKCYAGPNNNVDLDWMNDKIRYEETAEEADSVYMKGKNDNELKLIKDFITEINNGTINNKNKAGNEFRKLKQKVTNDELKQDLIKDLERYIFGEDIESIEPEEKYEKSIAERVKTRKQNTQKTSAPSSPPKKDYSEKTADFLEYMKKEKEVQKRFSDDYDSNGWSSGSGNVVSKAKGACLKILTNKQMLNHLPILLAQIQAGNNSIKLKNEIRQILYSLYRSKLLTKTVYNNFIKSIR